MHANVSSAAQGPRRAHRDARQESSETPGKSVPNPPTFRHVCGHVSARRWRGRTCPNARTRTVARGEHDTPVMGDARSKRRESRRVRASDRSLANTFSHRRRWQRSFSAQDADTGSPPLHPRSPSPQDRRRLRPHTRGGRRRADARDARPHRTRARRRPRNRVQGPRKFRRRTDRPEPDRGSPASAVGRAARLGRPVGRRRAPGRRSRYRSATRTPTGTRRPARGPRARRPPRTTPGRAPSARSRPCPPRTARGLPSSRCRTCRTRRSGRGRRSSRRRARRATTKDNRARIRRRTRARRG